MPPETVVHTSKFSSFVRGLSLILVGVIVGAIAALAGGYYVLASPVGESLIRNYFVPRPEVAAPEQNTPAPSSVATSSPQTNASSTVVLVPKAYANEAYYVAINRVVDDINKLNAVNVSLAPVLDVLNTQSLSCDFRGFYDHMTTARDLVDQDQTLTAQFASDLSDFSTANAATTDATTKTYTADAVSAGQALQQRLQTYTSTLSQILIGDVPTSAQTTELTNEVTATHDASQLFSTKMQVLLEHFGEAVQNAIQTQQ